MAKSRFIVVRINGDPSDTYAGRALWEVVDRANPDDGSLIEWGWVEASDVGAARLKTPREWKRAIIGTEEV